MSKLGQYILVIEDLPSMSLYLKVVLEQAGYRVDIAETGKSAIEKVHQSQGNGPFDLILTDLNLPDMDGLVLIKCLSQIPQCPPQVVLSAYADKEVQKRVLAEGASYYMEKPYNISALKRVIEELCNAKQKNLSQEEVELDTEYLQLRENYLNYLETLVDQLENRLLFQKLKSLVHQIKGSASLYGLKGLAEQAREFDEALTENGESVSSLVQGQLRQALINEGKSRTTSISQVDVCNMQSAVSNSH